MREAIEKQVQEGQYPATLFDQAAKEIYKLIGDTFRGKMSSEGSTVLLHRTLVARDKMKPLDLTHLTASCIRLADYQKCDKTVNTAYLQFAARIEGKPFTLDRPDASQGGMRARSTTAAF